MERSPSTGKRSPRIGTKTRKRAKTPDRRQSVPSDVLRRMALTSSAHKLEREQTRSRITPRSMITEYLSSQQTAEPVVRHKRRSPSIDPTSVRKRTKVSVTEEETPRTIMARFINQLQTQTPVVRQARRRQSEEEANFDGVLSNLQKRKSESFVVDDHDDENIITDSQPVQAPRNAEKLFRSKLMISSLVHKQLEQLERIGGHGANSNSQPFELRHRDMSKFVSHLGTIIHDSSPTMSAGTTASTDQTFDKAIAELATEGPELVLTSSKKRKASNGVSHDADDEIDVNNNSSYRDDASEGSPIRRNQSVSISGFELIPSSDIEENSSVFQELERPEDGFSPVLPMQAPGKLLNASLRSGIMAPRPRAPMMTTPQSEKTKRLTNSLEPDDPIRHLSRGHHLMTPKIHRITDISSKRSKSVTPRILNEDTSALGRRSVSKESRSMIPKIIDTNAIDHRRRSDSERRDSGNSMSFLPTFSAPRRTREIVTELIAERERGSTPQAAVVTPPATVAKTPESSDHAPKRTPGSSAAQLADDPRNLSTSWAASPRPVAKPKPTIDSPASVIGQANANLYNFFTSIEKRYVRTSTPAQKKSVASFKTAPKNTAKPRKSPTGKKVKPKKKEFGMSSAMMKKMFKHFCRFPVTNSAFDEIEILCEQFYENSASDLTAYAAHASRQFITCDDMILLMKRQRFITDKESLYSLVEKNLPLEYREKIIPMAISGNKLMGTALLKKRRGRSRKQVPDDDDDDVDDDEED